MDSLTQITLGAAVGEACLGKKMGNKGALWGAVFGVVPDLDVLVSPFVSNVQELIIHRGITHSLFFCIIAAPVFGWFMYRYYQDEPVSWRRWSLMVFLTIITHIFIDACTSYGTQIFQPFTNYSVSFSTIFIIDPFYTVPLLLGVGTALFLKRSSAGRRWANYIGLGLSSAYMLAGFFIKAHVNNVFEQNFERQQLSVERYMTTPMPFSEFLWVAYARSGDQIYAGLYSIFDEDRDVVFRQVDMNVDLVEPYKDQLPMQRILWFSHGYYAAEEKNGEVFIYDLRFGRGDLWMGSDPAPFVWTYVLEFNSDSTRVTGFRRPAPAFSFSGKLFKDLLDRISGEK
jgi:inner membrane protein